MLCYEIFKDNEVVGCAEVALNGLYYNVVCKCSAKNDGIFRIVLTCADKCINLGVCIPDKDGYVLRKRIPSKNIPSKNMRFDVCESSSVFGNEHVLRVDEPLKFSIAHLQHSHLRGEGSMHIIIDSNT